MHWARWILATTRVGFCLDDHRILDSGVSQPRPCTNDDPTEADETMPRRCVTARPAFPKREPIFISLFQGTQIQGPRRRSSGT